MLLNVMERLLLLSVLPSEGDVTTLRVLREAKAAIGLSDRDRIEFGIAENDGLVHWNDAGQEDREIHIGETAEGIIAAELKRRNDTKKLTENHISLFEKFCERAPAPPKPEKPALAAVNGARA